MYFSYDNYLNTNTPFVKKVVKIFRYFDYWKIILRDDKSEVWSPTTDMHKAPCSRFHDGDYEVALKNFRSKEIF